MKRIILDTNLWSDMGNDGTAEEFKQEMDNLNYAIMLPPSILLEILRSPNAEARRRRIEAMTTSRGIRLPSDAELCATDFIAAVKRLHPEWLQQFPDTGTWHMYHTYWTKRVWREADETPDVLRDYLMTDMPMEEQGVKVQRANRQSVIATNSSTQFSKALSALIPESEYAKHYVGLFDGSRVEFWRMDNGDRYWINMARIYVRHYGYIGQTERDWLGCYIDLRKATETKTEFRRLWFEKRA